MWGIADALSFTRCQDSSQSLPTPIYIHNIYIVFWGAEPMPYASSQARGQIRATAAWLQHSHNNMGSNLSL